MSVLANAQVRVVYWWGSNIPGLVSLAKALDDSFQHLPATHYFDNLAQYGVNPPTFVGSKIIPYTGPSPLDKTNIQSQIPVWVAQKVVNPGELLVVFCQPGLELTHDGESSFKGKGTKQFGGYHNHEDTGTGVNFAAIPWPQFLAGPSAGQNGSAFATRVLDSFTPATIHEVVETTTDPGLGGEEIGDPCQFGAAMRFGKWRVQKYWSDADNRCVPDGWFDWLALHGGIKGAPAAFSRQPTITDVFARGLDDKLLQRSFVCGQGWLSWNAVDSGNAADASFKLVSAPFADSMTPDHVQVFAYGTKGGNGDPQVYQKFWTASGGWGAWLPLGGKIKDRPTARSRQPTICDVFAWGLDDKLWQRSFVGGQGWLGWHAVDPGNPADTGFRLLSAPTADSMGPEHVHVFAYGTKGGGGDPQVYQKFWT